MIYQLTIIQLVCARVQNTAAQCEYASRAFNQAAGHFSAISTWRRFRLQSISRQRKVVS